MTTPGTPTFTPPAYSVPAFTAATVALNAVVTTVTLESTSGSAQTAIPFTFGHAFKSGDLAPGDFLRGTIAGEADVPLQFNAKATHPDGSIRHAIVSGVLPALGAGASKTMSLVRAASGTSTAAGAQTAAATAGLTASATIVTGGVTYTADATAALAANAGVNWLGGAIANDFILALPFKTSGGTAHPDITAQISVRHYAGMTKGRIGFTIEHTKAYSAANDVTYDITLTVSGSAVYSKTGINHFPAARFRRVCWWNSPAPLHIRHNSAYLTGTKQVANYDPRVTITEPTLAGYASTLAQPNIFEPMGSGPFDPYMPATGGRPDIGLLPAWCAAAVMSMDKRAVALSVASSEAGGSWNAHRRDDSTGPGAGYPLSIINWPSATILGNQSDTYNPATGQFENFPSGTSATNLVPDDAHLPNFPYLAYLLTGDYFHLEELQFWATWLGYLSNPYYRQHEKGLMTSGQLRAQGWSLRTVAEAAALTPDAHYLKSHFKYWTDNTIADYNARFTDNASANTLHINNSDIPHHGGIALPMWMEDFFAQSIGHAAELGFTEAGRLMAWKAKFQVGRMIGSGVCWIHAGMYDLKITATAGGALYGTLAECYSQTAAAGIDPYLKASVHALACGSTERLAEMNSVRPLPSNPFIANEMTGYSSNTDGYPACLNPALAMAVDSGYTDADLAWSLFDSRTNQPAYGTSPQFAIVPRGFAAAATAPVDNYSIGSGLTMYFGRSGI